MNGIRSIRKQLGLSQREFGKGIGVTQANVSHIEAGGQTVMPELAKRVIALAAKHGFDCTLDDVYSPAPQLRQLEDLGA